MGQRCSIEVLGGFTVEVDGRPVDTWRNRRAADLLKLLALSPGRRLHREQLMDALWPTLEVDAAAANLRKAVHYARRALGWEDAVRADVGMLVLDAEVEVDADGFVRAAETATDQADALLALALYAGEPLPTDRYEPWMQQPRAALLALHRRMLMLAEAWEQVVALDPTDEEAHRALMQRYLQEGRRREAIRQFEQLRDALREHIGVGPDPATIAVYEQVLAAEGAEPPTPQQRAAVLIANGLVAWNGREIEQAERLAREARALALEAGLGHELGEASTLLALVAYARGTWHDMFREDFEASLLHGGELELAIYDAHLCFQEFYLYGSSGHAEAAAFARELLAKAEQAGSIPGQALAHLLNGEFDLLSGRFDEAAPRLETAVALSRDGGCVSAQTIAIERLAELETLRGNEQRARELLAQAWPLAETSGISTHLIVRLYAVAVQAAENPMRAHAIVHEGERALADLPRVCPPCSIAFRVAGSKVCARAGDLPGARRHLDEADRITGLWQGGPWQAAVWEARATLRQAEGGRGQAAALFLEAAEVFERSHRPLDARRCRDAAATVAAQEPEPSPANLA